MFTELFTEARPDLIINTIPSYIVITYDRVLNQEQNEVEYYLIPLSEISENELAVLEYDGYFDSNYYSNELEVLLLRFEEFKTDTLIIKANIVAIYRK